MSEGASSTQQAVAADAASRDEPSTAEPVAEAPQVVPTPPGAPYQLGNGVLRDSVRPHERRAGEPIYRPLRIYTVDPSHHQLEGAIATVNVAYEPLRDGPVGALLEVEDIDAASGHANRKANLDDPFVLMTDGYEPSPSDPRFHQQMVYAVCSNVYSAFRTALGRTPGWGFGGASRPARLVIRPHFAQEANAYYERVGDCGELRFGYYAAGEHPTDRTLPGGIVFTCLSHDIVVHEMTHALLDGLRAHFMVPTNPDVTAFHEAFADIVAVFQHFSYPEVVRAAIRQCRGALNQSALLSDIARQFGHTTSGGGALRTAIDTGQARRYRAELEPHELGSVLVSAVFEAFTTVFDRKTQALVRLATGGTGELPVGELPHDLQQLLAARASKLASQFIAICIRAIDYCPPTGMMFGDYLRALITADHDLVPDDPWDYRGALIDAFWRRGIYPRSASHLSQDALRWRAPRIALKPVPDLDFATLKFRGDPAQAADADELRRQADALGAFVTLPGHLGEFGLVAAGDARLESGDTVERPMVQSIRSARRAGPSGQVVFDLVAEVTQAMHVAPGPDGPGFTHHGGCTIILSPEGEVRFVVLKSLLADGRVGRRRDYLLSELGQRHWRLVGNQLVPSEGLFRTMHVHGRG
ncbi:MAG: peptidase M4 [Paucibacter sp.]|nr:peptidase M4 [Roseateles sp.]